MDKRTGLPDIRRLPAEGLRHGPGRRQEGLRPVAGEGRRARAYGRNHFGQSCLLARRLVEQGVPFITINMDGWDTHTDNFGAMKNLLPMLDKGFAALMEDLAERGLLQSTIVLWYGEFGRTPKIDWSPPVERRPAPLPLCLFGRGRRRRIQRRHGRRLQRRQGRASQGAARLSLGPRGQHLQAAGHRSRRPASASARLRRPRSRWPKGDRPTAAC